MLGSLKRLPSKFNITGKINVAERCYFKIREYL